MRTLIWSNTFLRAFKRLLKKQPDRREEIEKTLRLLLDSPFNPKLETHKLKWTQQTQRTQKTHTISLTT
jgi:mRNA-degrading endonuclease YafQ of YafQ-DinJ toxin-antitoxin module